MNKIPRKPIVNKVLTPSPGLSGNGHLSKTEFLRKYEENDNISDNDDIFGEVEDDLDEDFQTLKLSGNDLDTIRGNLFKSGTTDTFPEFKEIPDLEFSPMDSISTSSPKLSLMTGQRSKHFHDLRNNSKRVTRKTLSDYSEGDETDETSQMNDDEFENLDDIFGIEEQGAYDRIQRKLQSKQFQLKTDAEREEAELKSRMNTNKQYRLANQANFDSNMTLKLKDFSLRTPLSQNNLNSHNELDHEQTIDFEYIPDEFEEFEDGFDANFEHGLSTIKPHKLTRFHSSSKLNPSTERKQQEKHASIKKFKSTMDFAGQNSKDNEMEPKKYNFDNRVKSRLERIPSFYNKPKEIPKEKQTYLNKFQESDLVAKEAKKSQYHKQQTSTVGLLRYLNNNTVVTIPVIPTNMNMKFNASSLTWEGNEIDLLRFENLQKPSLITLHDVKGKSKDTYNNVIPQLDNNNMKFDSENLRWVNINEENESIFNEIPDLEDNSKNNYVSYRLSSPPKLKNVVQQLQSPMKRRGFSQFTQRTLSTNTDTSGSIEPEHNEFFISEKLLERFMKEEIKIARKINHWFRVDEIYDYKNPSSNINLDYYWEIRKMVIDTE